MSSHVWTGAGLLLGAVVLSAQASAAETRITISEGDTIGDVIETPGNILKQPKDVLALNGRITRAIEAMALQEEVEIKVFQSLCEIGLRAGGGGFDGDGVYQDHLEGRIERVVTPGQRVSFMYATPEWSMNCEAWPKISEHLNNNVFEWVFASFTYNRGIVETDGGSFEIVDATLVDMMGETSIMMFGEPGDIFGKYAPSEQYKLAMANNAPYIVEMAVCENNKLGTVELVGSRVEMPAFLSFSKAGGLSADQLAEAQRLNDEFLGIYEFSTAGSLDLDLHDRVRRLEATRDAGLKGSAKAFACGAKEGDAYSVYAMVSDLYAEGYLGFAASADVVDPESGEREYVAAVGRVSDILAFAAVVETAPIPGQSCLKGEILQGSDEEVYKFDEATEQLFEQLAAAHPGIDGGSGVLETKKWWQFWKKREPIPKFR